MNNDKLIFIGIGFLFVVILCVVFFTMLSKSSKNVSSNAAKKTFKPQLSELDEMIYKVSQEDISESDILVVVENFLKTQKLEKKSPNPSDICKKQLDFITKVAANKNSSSKTIAKLNIEFKKNNPEYYKEIEMCEALGLMRRK